jgi:murein DD-endopeptidase MepM/ murein hydrolase activator NlpD
MSRLMTNLTKRRKDAQAQTFQSMVTKLRLDWYFRLPLWIPGVVALLLILLAIGLSQPGNAQLPSVLPPAAPLSPSISVTPQKPRLGDTLSVMINGAEGIPAPNVLLDGKPYPSFPIGNNRYRALLPTTPLDRPGTMTIQVEGGPSQSLKLANRNFPTQRIWLPPGQDGNVSDAEYDRVDAFKQVLTPEKYWNGPMQRPNRGEITSVYGVRRYYNGEFAQDYYHRGVDYGGATGSPIVAAAAGRVALVGHEKDGFEVHGNCVGLNHGQGVTSIYIHMSKVMVQNGDYVQAGQQIGTLGSTGAATGPHLHWGLFVHGKAVDPVPWRETGFE